MWAWPARQCLSHQALAGGPARNALPGWRNWYTRMPKEHMV